MDSSSPGKGKVNAVMNLQVSSKAEKATISCTCATLLYTISGYINTQNMQKHKYAFLIKLQYMDISLMKRPFTKLNTIPGHPNLAPAVQPTSCHIMTSYKLPDT